MKFIEILLDFQKNHWNLLNYMRKYQCILNWPKFGLRSRVSGSISWHWPVCTDKSEFKLLHLSLLHVQGVDSRVLQRSLQRWHLSLLCFDMYPDSVKSKILFYKFRMWSILNMVVFHVFRGAKQFWPNKTLTNTTETRINRINIHSSALNGVIQAKIISFGSEYVHFRGHFG